jgi:ABC-type multidrug transport system fused ATPase/permease subunit
LRTFGRKKQILERYLKVLGESMNSWILVNSLYYWMQVRLLLAGNLVFLFVAISTIIVICVKDDFNYTILSFALTYSLLLTTQFDDLLYFFCGVEQRLVSVERVNQYLNPDQLEDLHAKNKNQEINNTSDSEIEFRNINLTYDDEIKEDTKYVLKNFNLKI